MLTLCRSHCKAPSHPCKAGWEIPQGYQEVCIAFMPWGWGLLWVLDPNICSNIQRPHTENMCIYDVAGLAGGLKTTPCPRRLGTLWVCRPKLQSLHVSRQWGRGFAVTPALVWICRWSRLISPKLKKTNCSERQKLKSFFSHWPMWKFELQIKVVPYFWGTVHSGAVCAWYTDHPLVLQAWCGLRLLACSQKAFFVSLHCKVTSLFRG